MSKRNILLIIIVLGVFSNMVFAHDINECERIVSVVVEAINQKAPERIEEYLSSDFSISGQTGLIANHVIKQLLSQLNDEVQSYTKITEEVNGDELILVYEFNYAKVFGKRTSTFVFNQENKFLSINLFELQVKTIAQSSDQYQKSSEDIITIPIELKEEIPIALANINGESRNFAIDTGAPVLILNSKYFETETADDSKETDTTQRRVLGGTAQGVNTSVTSLDTYRINDFDFYGISREAGDVLTMDISHLEEEMQIELYGLLGYEIFKEYDMLFDYSANIITLLNPDITESYLSEHFPKRKIHKIPMETCCNHIPIIKVKIGKDEFNFGFDSGAGGNLLDIKHRDKVKKQISSVSNDLLHGAGESRNVEIGVIKNMNIGKLNFKNTYTVFNDMSHLNASSEKQMDGLFGHEILRQKKTLISFVNNQLIFID